MNKPPEQRKQDLLVKRKEVHGKQRNLHERLVEVCEDFVVGHGLTKGHKQKALVRELRYLLDYYQDEESWREVE